MSSKKFPKPNWRRIVIFIMIYIALMCFVMTLGTIKKNCEFVMQRGLPFRYFSARGGACEKNGVIQLIEFRAHFSSIFLIFDVLTWGLISYFLSFLAVWIYDKTKKKKVTVT